MDPFAEPGLTSLSQELVCNILSFLPVKDLLSMGMTCKKFATSVKIHLRLCKKLDLCDTEVWGSMPDSVSDDQLYSLLSKCPKLVALYGLRPHKVESRRLRRKTALSVLGIIDALLLCPCLKKVETNNFQILEALLQYLPDVEIVGHFRNEGGGFPPDTTKQLKMNQYPLITSLHLTGIFIPELTYMPELKDLHLLWVRFTKFEPFKSLSVPKLKTFVMKQCFGPDFPIRYMPLFSALSHAPDLQRLECIRLPVPGGLIQRAVEESWDIKGFQNLKKLVIEGIKDITANDIGYLIIAACKSLEHLRLNPAGMSDNFFAPLHFAGCHFENLKTLCIAAMDALWSKGSASEFAKVPGTYSVPNGFMPIVYCEETSTITDRGVQIMGLLFPNCESLTLAHCPHLISCEDWIKEDTWSNLRHLTLRHCYRFKASTFTNFLENLKCIEVVILKEVFYERPKGCSNVGLSVGTGIGLSSAVVRARNERLAFNVPEEQIEVIINPEHDFFHFRNRNIQENRRGAPRVLPFVVVEDSDDEEDDSDDNDDNDDANNDNYGLEGHIAKFLGDFEQRLQPNFSYPTNKVVETTPAETSYSGPVTRNHKHMLSSTSSRRNYCCSQGTQTCHCIMRRNVSRTLSTPCPKKCQCYNVSKSHLSYKRENESSKPSCDKSTSTNDPIYEEDTLQNMTVTSKTLKSLTIMSTGLTSVHLYDTPALQHLEVQGNRVLRELQLHHSYKNLTRINVSSCPKFNFETLLCSAQNCISGPTLLYFKPYLPRYSVSEMIETVFGMEECAIFFAILYDYSPVDSNRAIYRENMLAWLDLLKIIIIDAGRICAKKSLTTKMHYSHMHRIHGEFPDASSYELVTNNPLLASLWRRYPNSIEICPKDDLYFNNTEIVSSLKEEIAEMVEVRQKYPKTCLGCYIHMPE